MPTFKANPSDGFMVTKSGYGKTECWKRHAGELTTDGTAALCSSHRVAQKVTSLTAHFKTH